MNKNEYALYDKQDNELIIGIFSIDEIMEMFNTTRGVVHSYVCRGQSFRGRYLIKKVESEEEWNT
ncbi:MAG: hypothetical protein RR598_11565 [Anaerorhabdus sp.]